MKLLNFKSEGGLRVGLKTAAGVVDVAAAGVALGIDFPASTDAIVAAGDDLQDQLHELAEQASVESGASWLLNEDDLTLGPVLTNPGKIICVGLNYRKHAEETNSPIPENPVLFSKFNNTIAGPNDDVPLGANAVKYDYEVELAFVIGKKAVNVSEADALDYVYGYFTANDVSVRDLQNRTSQWLLGKTLDKFFPIGPYLVTADEVGDPQNLRLTTVVNGEPRQDSNTSDMIFTIAQQIAYITKYFPLLPGDIITTGTPAGVAMGLPNTPWLVPGDSVTVELEKLGALTNGFIAG
jgi:2-keto-4-pentenoate hydratase/2-oxohepta-3-ene-1,7-dioic acid hydratase in catechol pathway